MTTRRGIFVAPFDELSEPGQVAELAARAEQRGWDGFFVWDHLTYREPVRAVADPWVTLAAVAVATQRVVIGSDGGNRSGALDRRGRDLVPDRIRAAAHRPRGGGSDRRLSLGVSRRRWADSEGRWASR